MTLNQLGRPCPLGAEARDGGVNFAVVAPEATHVELLLFDQGSSPAPSQTIHLGPAHRSGDVWHVFVDGMDIGCRYGYKVHGPVGAGFNPAKVLLDPCARAIDGWSVYERQASVGKQSNLSSCLKGVVTERKAFNFTTAPRPRHPWRNTIIYELHAGGMTRGPGAPVPAEERGTLLGLCHLLPRLKSLGITTIELLPLQCFDPLTAPPGQQNYWGYAPINWFSLHPAYVVGNDPLQARQQMRTFVEACHKEDLEVLVDVVYNHTGEEGANGPTISWRGFGEQLYYFCNDTGCYQDVSGCGNSIAANRPHVQQLILESLRCWAVELGVDGFRFDLAAALTRGEHLAPLKEPPLFRALEADPLLADLKWTGEPWDCGGLYRLADFPAQRFGVWNGCFRDDLRRFWKGEKDTCWTMRQRLSGNRDLFAAAHVTPGRSIHFVTAHDGFTLQDLVSYNVKHNLANGENNRDGENHNHSWNCGVEGPSSDSLIQALRHRQVRNLITSLLLAPGVPLLWMGDEVNRSQGGNNNSWCQDNPVGWMAWEHNPAEQAMEHYVGRLNRLRRELGSWLNPSMLIQEQSPSPSVQPYRQWHGPKLNRPDYGPWSHALAWSVHTATGDVVLWCGLNGFHESLQFELPRSRSGWHRLINTALPPGDDLPSSPSPWDQEGGVLLESHSLVLMVASRHCPHGLEDGEADRGNRTPIISLEG